MGFFKRERSSELLEFLTIISERKAFLRFTLRIHIQQLRCHITNFLRRFAARLAPGFGA